MDWTGTWASVVNACLCHGMAKDYVEDMHGGDEKSIQNFHHKFLKGRLRHRTGIWMHIFNNCVLEKKTDLHGSLWAPMVGGCEQHNKLPCSKWEEGNFLIN